MTTSDLYEYELLRHRLPVSGTDHGARNRAALDGELRRARPTRRHRVADRLRSVADRLDG